MEEKICAQCGTVNPPNAKFCMECGSKEFKTQEDILREQVVAELRPQIEAELRGQIRVALEQELREEYERKAKRGAPDVEKEPKWQCTPVSAQDAREVTALVKEVLATKTNASANAVLKEYEDRDIEYYRNSLSPAQTWYGDRVWCAQAKAELRASVEKELRASIEKEVQSETQIEAPERAPQPAEKSILTQKEIDECFQRGDKAYSKRDYDEAVRQFAKVAPYGHVEAQRLLGYCYLYGYGVQVDYAEAVKWLRNAAEADDQWAQNLLGDCYAAGHGVERSIPKAVYWYRKAAAQGNDFAQTALDKLKIKGLI